jgi:hypothetical protein
MLGEFLEKNCPDVSVKVIIKHQTEWGEFLDSVRNNKCNCFRFVVLMASIQGPVL